VSDFTITLTRDQLNRLTVELARVDPKHNPVIAAFNKMLFELMQAQQQSK